MYHVAINDYHCIFERNTLYVWYPNLFYFFHILIAQILMILEVGEMNELRARAC